MNVETKISVSRNLPSRHKAPKIGYFHRPPEAIHFRYSSNFQFSFPKITGMLTFFGDHMAKPNLASMSVEALLQLRTDVAAALSRKAKELTSQLSRLGGEIGSRQKRRGSALKGRKVPAKYRDRSGNTWAGRGAIPVWLRDKIKAGAKLQDFAVGNKVASRRKFRTRRKSKR
jgi:DNA-binding protein H-NS